MELLSEYYFTNMHIARFEIDRLDRISFANLALMNGKYEYMHRKKY